MTSYVQSTALAHIALARLTSLLSAAHNSHKTISSALLVIENLARTTQGMGLRKITISHRITSHHITPHHITSHQITSNHITSHHITSHHITSHHITSHHRPVRLGVTPRRRVHHPSRDGQGPADAATRHRDDFPLLQGSTFKTHCPEMSRHRSYLTPRMLTGRSCVILLPQNKSSVRSWMSCLPCAATATLPCWRLLCCCRRGFQGMCAYASLRCWWLSLSRLQRISGRLERAYDCGCAVAVAEQHCTRQ